MSFHRSLSARLLLWTIVFVMLAEVLIFVPSLARFRIEYMRERLARSEIVALVVDRSPAPVESALAAQLLRKADVWSVAVRDHDMSRVILPPQTPVDMVAEVRLDEESAVMGVFAALRCAFVGDNGAIRVLGRADLTAAQARVYDVIIDGAKLRYGLLDYAIRIFWLSLIISLFTAALVYLTLSGMLVRPMRRVIASMTAFRANPEASAVISPSRATNEIGDAERELAAMQTELRAALRQKSRLAALGEAVAKINHDLRNILASVQLVTDRLETSDDPLVRRIASKLVRAIDRATGLCEQTLEFGRAEENPPQRRRVVLASLLEEVAESVGAEGVVAVEAHADPDVILDADPDQMFRILLNLARNAAQAIESSGRGGRIVMTAKRTETGAEIDVMDDGPGLPAAALEHLFKPFKAGVRRGGTGLGLAIANELARGHGGDLTLVRSDAQGALFRVVIPNMA